ncbi:FAD-dependent oxidoreductase [Mycolicibacterium pulveris]|uniref:Oxidoreductase n=1 Tax=Mycolicibacterium pulveris TaxID=36813 RepID=A0A7I7UFW2_MYCPV|nr:FAD-dependent oxidoreductase [Mycolicibacterium pulveris]MCV6981632.1 FAD-dependent oxidoreductase [Mycolicibacterium pulveris]BBY80212.1 oxidoreductase [Mycolicibacterium pulveris]
MSSIVVVGAGLSGLTAAYRLSTGGADVVVLEAGPRPGGRVDTETHGAYVVDTGPDALTAGYARYLRLVEDLGLQHRLADTAAVIGLVRDGRIIDVDPGKPWRLPFTPALSFAAKIRMLGGLVHARKAIAEVDSYEMSCSAARDDPERSAAEFATDLFGTEVADYLIDPLMRLTTGSGAANASCVNVLGALGAWSSSLKTVRGGLGIVTDELADRLDVRYGATVTRVDDTATGVVIGYHDESGEHEMAADGCVIGAMYHQATEMWPTLSAACPAFGDKLRNVKLISVSLGYSAHTATRAYPVLVPTTENPEALLIFMQHNKCADRAPDGHSLVTIYTDTTVTDSFLDRTDRELELWAAGIIEGLCPELVGRREMSVVTRWPMAGYLADPGFWRRSSRLLESLPTDGRVKVAGDLFGAGSMESATRWGERAAEELLRHLDDHR